MSCDAIHRSYSDFKASNKTLSATALAPSLLLCVSRIEVGYWRTPTCSFQPEKGVGTVEWCNGCSFTKTRTNTLHAIHQDHRDNGTIPTSKRNIFQKVFPPTKKTKDLCISTAIADFKMHVVKVHFEKSHEVPLKGHLRSNNPRHGHPVRPTHPRIPAIQGEERQDQKLSLKQLLGKWHE